MKLTLPTLGLLCVVVLVAAVARQASAITINRNFIPAGITVTIPGIGPVTSSAPPAVSAGGGDLIDIFNVAADIWEASILDPHVVSLSFGWADLDFLSTDTLGVNIPLNHGGPPLFRETEGLIGFDSTRTDWFLDGTPLEHSEYANFEETIADLGGGPISTGRQFVNGTGDAAGGDLLTVALHEIGHALGLTSFLPPYGTETLADDDIDVTAPRPFVGSIIPTTNFLGSAPPAPANLNAHLNIAEALMNPGLFDGERRFPSAADILANAQISQFETVELDAPLAFVPEPASACLLFTGLVLAISARRPRFRKRSS